MLPSPIRRTLIAGTTLAMVAAGSGVASADPSPRAPASTATNDNPWGIDFRTFEGLGTETPARQDRPAAAPEAPSASRAQEGEQTDSLAVTTTDDGVEGSLRAAVRSANDADGPVVIELQAGETYVLDVAGAGEDDAATGDLDVAGDLTIVGDATIDASALGDRILDVAAEASLTLDGPTLTGGTPPETESGGAIRSTGTTALANVTVSDSVAMGAGASGGAVFNDGGDLLVTDSTLTGNSATRAGGAIEANAGTTTLDGAELSGNATGDEPGNGGGLHLTGAGIVTVTDSVVSDNVASAEGGGLWNSASGTMHVTDTTIHGNVASGDDADQGGGGVFSDGGFTRLLRTTVTDNVADGASGSGGGALNNAGTLRITRSTISGNTSNRAGGGIEANVGRTELYRVDLDDNATGAAPGNGGGLHLTGAGRVIIHDGSISGNSAAAEGGGLWNSASGSMVLRFAPTIIGNVASGDDADQGGGGLFNDGGSLRIEQGARISDNVADGASGSGGGILNNQGDLTVVDAAITGNASNRAGGGVEAVAGTTTLRGVDLSDNDTGAAPGNGGGLHLTGAGDVTVTDARVTGNTAAAEGGGLWNSAVGTMNVTDSDVSGNTASGDASDQGGGGIFNDGGRLKVLRSTVNDNVADGSSGSGGGLLNDGGLATVTRSAIQGNTSSRAGGGVEANVGRTRLYRVNLDGNSTGAAPGNGGGLHLTGSGFVTIHDGTVTDNSAAAEGGGLWNSATGTMRVRFETEIGGNTAPIGPDVFNDGGTFTVDGDPVPVG